MSVYIITWFLFSIFSLIEVNTQAIPRFKKLNILLVTLCFIILSVQVGMRWETATDWFSYLNFFESQSNLALSADLDKFEVGYVYMNRIVHLLSSDYSVFLIIHSLLFFSLLFSSFRMFSSYFILSIFLYYSINIGMTGSNRQLLAVAIGIFGVKYLIEEKKIYFFICVLVAFLFHATALLLLIYYFLNRKYNSWTLLGAVLLAILIGYSNLPQQVFSFAGGLGEQANEKVEAYLDLSSYGDGVEGSIVGVIKRLVLTILFIISAKKVGAIDKTYYLCLNGFIVSIVFFFLFKSVPIMGGRAILYFNIMEPVLMCYLLYLFKDHLMRNLIVITYSFMAIFYFYQSINQYPNIFIPYKGLFINTKYDRGNF